MIIVYEFVWQNIVYLSNMTAFVKEVFWLEKPFSDGQLVIDHKDQMLVLL